MKHSEKQVIIIFGPPGSGKGTQSELLSDKLGLYLFETSKILEAKFQSADSQEKIKIKDKEYDIRDEKRLWEEGILCSPPFVSYLVKEKIRELFDSGKSLALSGSPRTLFEGRELIPLLKELYGAENISVILLEISPEETVFRNSHRRICQLMRHPILYSRETAKLKTCPLDGSKLVKRKGLDDPETIKVRLKEYKERTLPLLEYFREEGIEIKKINGEQAVADVFKDILNALK